VGRVEARLHELGIELPAPTPWPGHLPLIPAVRVGNLIWLSGKTSKMTGKVGRDVTVEQGYDAAKECAIGLIATLRDELGDLDKVKRIVKLLSMVNATDTLTQQPQVAHGCSDLLVAVWGEHGRHARSAVGMASLPGDATVEVELIAEVE